ncbi:SpoIID/LytB domain-containing protein [Planococcus sp. X10-3]|uniref:SpoIID/LytB domain-containing protein n=1 Tax=Planococcus sp. X10-3 TaxID=3061240 RepID=UPI003BAFD86F
MKKLVKLLSFTLLLGMLIGVTQVSAAPEDFSVKVKLINTFGAQGPYTTYIFEPKGESVLKENTSVVLAKDKKYTVLVVNGKMAIKEGTKVIAKDLATVTVAPKVYNKENHVYIYRGNKPEIKHPYMGTITFRMSGTTQIQPVNELLFEDYLKGVLPGETPASWGNQGGMEALKAQAIAARSYVFAKAGGKFTVEIDDSTNFQVFKGFIWDKISPKYLSAYENTNRAVDETAGQVMTFKKPDGKDGFVRSYFSASNGGQTELPQQYWSGKVPYLTKSQKDDYDLESKISWELTWLRQQLNSSLDLSSPAKWWGDVGEKGLYAANMPKANDSIAFKEFKKYVQNELTKLDSSIESIKIASIDSMSKKDYPNTGKVSEITTNISYYTRHKNGTTLSYDMIPGAQSQTLSGELRYDTAANIAREYVGSGKANTIVLGRGDIPADALAGTVLAHKFSAPLLLTRNNSLPATVESFVKDKVNPGAKVYLLGGKSAISASLEKNLRDRGFDVERLSGENRTDTSIAIAKEVGSTGGKAMIASGSANSSDALSASAYAASKQIPIIIHFGKSVTAQTTDYFTQSGTKTISLIGGTAAIPALVQTELQKNFTVERISGKTRVDTSIAVNEQLPLTGENIVIGNAYQFIDSLAGSVLAAKTGSPIILLHPDADKMPTSFFEALPVKKQAYFLGGSKVISEDLKAAVNEYVAGELKKKKMAVTFKGSVATTYPATMSSYRTMLGVGVLKSVDFDLVNSTDKIVMNGKGHGHGIGMSQHGAFNRSVDGHSASDILNFYYQGITIKTREKIIQ